MIRFRASGRPIEVVVLLVLLSQSANSNPLQCIHVPDCICPTPDQANCTGRRLSIVPLNLSPSIKSLVLKRNRIATLKADHLEIYPSLEWLDLSLQTHDLALIESPFKSLRRLTTLILHGSTLRNLSQSTFIGLTSLRQLDLSRTRLHEFKNGPLFTDLESIEEIRLSDNRFGAIDRAMLDGIVGLRTLYLDYNELQNVPFLANLVNLKNLDLSGNRISRISAHDFEGLRSLERLVLDSNPITSIEGLSSLSNVKDLSLKATTLFTVPSLELKAMPALHHLDLSSSVFEVLPPHAFDSFPKLTTLTLRGCMMLKKVQNLAFNNLPLLTTLSLKDNHVLSSLAPNWIANSPRLGDLKLDGCSLTLLPRAGLNVHKTLDISATGNEWSCGCENTFLADACRRQESLEGSACGATCKTGEAIGQRLQDVALEPCKSTVTNVESSNNEKLYLALAVAIPLVVLTVVGILMFVYRKRLRVCCGKSTAVCLCKKSSSFQSKQPLVTMANWRQFTGQGQSQTVAIPTPPETPVGQTSESAYGDEQSGEKPPYRIIAEYPVPITEL